MCIDCFSCALKNKFIKIITEYGALIISVIPGTCNGSSVRSLPFLQTMRRGVYVSQKPNLTLYFVPLLHFNLKGRGGYKGSLKLCEIRKTGDEGNKMGEWEREELLGWTVFITHRLCWAFLICPSPAILLMTCYFWINRNEETCSSVILKLGSGRSLRTFFFCLVHIILDVATVLLKVTSRSCNSTTYVCKIHF